MSDQKLTLAAVINDCPLIDELYSELSDEDVADASRWFRWLRDRIATETAAERDAEIARLKAELAAARTAKPAPKPKPRRTGGQKLFEARYASWAWPPSINGEREQWEAAARTLGIPDDPEPPSDGELMRQCVDAWRSDYGRMVVAFDAMRAERDGARVMSVNNGEDD